MSSTRTGPTVSGWQALGSALPLLPRPVGTLRAGLLSHHRAQSAPRRHGDPSPAIQVVELPDQRRRQGKPSDRTARPIRAARPRPGRAPRSLSGPVPRGVGQAAVNEIRAATNGGFVLGAARLHEQIAAQLGRRVTPGQAGRPPRKDTERASAGPNRLQARPGAMAAVDAKAADVEVIEAVPEFRK
jgi:hypothetical protein